MKSEFQAKFLQNLLKKRENEGFTLIELLVVIIIIGILSAIALPSFLNQANKARESEAKQYTGSMNRAQQANYLEKQTFTTSMAALGVGIATQTANYQYWITSTQAASIAANGTANVNTHMFNVGDPINTSNLRAFIGTVDVLTEGTTGSGAATTTAVLCQSENPASPSTATGAITINTSATVATAPSCGTGYVDISK